MDLFSVHVHEGTLTAAFLSSQPDIISHQEMRGAMCNHSVPQRLVQFGRIYRPLFSKHHSSTKASKPHSTNRCLIEKLSAQRSLCHSCISFIRVNGGELLDEAS